MGAAKANNSKDTYLATAVTFMVIGALFLIDKLIHFSSIGLPWVMNKDNMLLYAAACFLIFKRDKSIGLVLLGLWLVMNIGLVLSLYLIHIVFPLNFASFLLSSTTETMSSTSSGR